MVLCLVRLPGTAPGTVGSGTVGWLVVPFLPPPSPALRLTSRSPDLPLLGSVPLSVFPRWCISFHLSGLPHLSFPVSVSPSWLLNVFLSPSTALSVSLHLLSLLISVSPYLCLSPISVSLRLCPPEWVRVGPGQPGPGAEANNAPFTRPVGAMATLPPRPPRARAASAKRMPWLRQARARPARRRPARSWRGQTGRGRLASASVRSQEGRPPRGLQPLSASVSPSVNRQGWAK